MKVQIKNRWNDSVIYTADIPDDTPSGMATRVALEQAVDRRAYLHGADLRGANLGGAYLGGADLREAYLRGADLGGADLHGANLRGAYLRGANLGGADLREAYLRGADLGGADLRGANLGGAYLREIGSLWGTAGNMHEIKSLMIETWPVAYTATHMQIGCQLHPLADWWAFDDATINGMAGKALEWWRKWKPVLQQVIDMSPATPGGEKPEQEPDEEGQSDE